MSTPQDPPGPDDPRGSQPSRQLFSMIGFALGAVSLLFYPIVFGILGVVLGVVGHGRGEPLGKWAAVTAGVCMLIGMLIGVLVMNAVNS